MHESIIMGSTQNSPRNGQIEFDYRRAYFECEAHLRPGVADFVAVQTRQRTNDEDVDWEEYVQTILYRYRVCVCARGCTFKFSMGLEYGDSCDEMKPDMMDHFIECRCCNCQTCHVCHAINRCREIER
jgi:hypothetical protein